ncbi:ScbR family autoregulator-binding transcription factor [Streptomyces apricus]|uniref:TetR/AcrR family transcriptional regulator n=1 Tax=Streptomyces apricus TaxID=1828112 RepID=A0A5B0BNY4_9ACTN|nr:ScbR family autoregulator-binding transcription factor [Streptomyces apricus]KAA0942485.1 TetR/AcrR family transcriptional regulator [Streptomyces apricus]
MVQQERAVRTRRSILAAGAQEFAERGYEAATCAGIAERAGVTRGALYFHFPSKRDVAAAVLQEWIDRGPVAGPFPCKLEELTRRALATARLLEDDAVVRAGFRLCLEQGLETAERKRPYLAWTGRYAELLEAARAQGDVRAETATDEIAELIVGCFAGARLVSQLVPEGDDVEHRVRSALRHLLPHAAAPGALDGLGLTPGPPTGPGATPGATSGVASGALHFPTDGM